MKITVLIPGEHYKASMWLGKGKTEEVACLEMKKEVAREHPLLRYYKRVKQTTEEKKVKLTCYFKLKK